MAIKKNSNDTFTIDYTDNTGRRIRKRIKGSRTLAQHLLEKALTEIREGKYFPDRAKQKVEFKTVAKEYWDMHGSVTKSAPKMIYNFNIIVRYFGDKQIAAITPRMIQEFYNKKAIENSPSTANRYFTLIRAIINYGIKNKLYIGDNPCNSVSRKPDNPARTRYLTIEIRISAGSRSFRISSMPNRATSPSSATPRRRSSA